MTISIASAVARFKGEPECDLDHRLVLEACAQFDHRWRDRVLDPVTTARLFILQVLHGNVSCRAVRHLSGVNVFGYHLLQGEDAATRRVVTTYRRRCD